MTIFIGITVLILTLAVLWLSLGPCRVGPLPGVKVADRTAAEAAWRQHPIAGMSFDQFADIRAKSILEREQFGDGSFAPYFPTQKHNGTYSLARGVWLEDGMPRPSDAVLDAVRQQYQRDYERIEYMLVEGEQDAPLGKAGAMIRVIAHNMSTEPFNGIPTIPSFSVHPVNATDGTWASSISGQLPTKMSQIRKRAR